MWLHARALYGRHIKDVVKENDSYPRKASVLSQLASSFLGPFDSHLERPLLSSVLFSSLLGAHLGPEDPWLSIAGTVLDTKDGYLFSSTVFLSQTSLHLAVLLF